MIQKEKKLRENKSKKERNKSKKNVWPLVDKCLVTSGLREDAV